MLTRFLARTAGLTDQKEDEVPMQIVSAAYFYQLHPRMRDPSFYAVEQVFSYQAPQLLRERHLRPLSLLFDIPFFDAGFPAKCIGEVQFLG